MKSTIMITMLCVGTCALAAPSEYYLIGNTKHDRISATKKVLTNPSVTVERCSQVELSDKLTFRKVKKVK